MREADTHYNPTDPRTGRQGQSYYVPVDAGEQNKCAMAQASADPDIDPEMLREMRPIALPQVPLLPPRFGYGHPVVDVGDCFDVSRDPNARYDFSGSQGGYEGASHPSLGMW